MVVYVDGYIYGKTPYSFKTYAEAAKKMVDFSHRGFRAIIVGEIDFIDGKAVPTREVPYIVYTA